MGIPQRSCPAFLWASQEVWSGLPLWVLDNWRFELNMTVERKTRAPITDQPDSGPEPWSALKGPDDSIQTLPSPSISDPDSISYCRYPQFTLTLNTRCVLHSRNLNVSLHELYDNGKFHSCSLLRILSPERYRSVATC